MDLDRIWLWTIIETDTATGTSGSRVLSWGEPFPIKPLGDLEDLLRTRGYAAATAFALILHYHRTRKLRYLFGAHVQDAKIFRSYLTFTREKASAKTGSDIPPCPELPRRYVTKDTRRTDGRPTNGSTGSIRDGHVCPVHKGEVFHLMRTISFIGHCHPTFPLNALVIINNDAIEKSAGSNDHVQMSRPRRIRWLEPHPPLSTNGR